MFESRTCHLNENRILYFVSGLTSLVNPLRWRVFGNLQEVLCCSRTSQLSTDRNEPLTKKGLEKKGPNFFPGNRITSQKKFKAHFHFSTFSFFFFLLSLEIERALARVHRPGQAGLTKPLTSLRFDAFPRSWLIVW